MLGTPGRSFITIANRTAVPLSPEEAAEVEAIIRDSETEFPRLVWSFGKHPPGNHALGLQITRTDGANIYSSVGGAEIGQLAAEMRSWLARLREWAAEPFHHYESDFYLANLAETPEHPRSKAALAEIHRRAGV